MRRFLAVSLLVISPCFSEAAPVAWPKAAIHASVLRDVTALKIGQFIQLDRELRQNESGWKQMRIDVPDDWRILRADVDDEGFSVALASGRIFRVSREKIGDLTFRILNGGKKSDAELANIWAPYERHG